MLAMLMLFNELKETTGGKPYILPINFKLCICILTFRELLQTINLIGIFIVVLLKVCGFKVQIFYKVSYRKCVFHSGFPPQQPQKTFLNT